MDRFTGYQRVFCVKQFYKHYDSFGIVRSLFRTHLLIHNWYQYPSLNLIKSWIKKLREIGSILREKKNMMAMEQRREEDPGLSMRKDSTDFDDSKSALYCKFNWM